jgi:N,N'-diacetyllegionaminate synthase
MSTRIIAEIAQGYEGRADYCDFYVRAAAKAGADAVKFQIVYADDVAEPGYQYYEWFKKLEMDLSVWQAAKARAVEMNILLFADVSGKRALRVAEAIKPDGIKIHSSNFFNRAVIREAFEIAGQVFVSLGGVTAEEIAGLIADVEKWHALDRLTLLYGFQSEPTPVASSSLARLPLLRSRFPHVGLGYLDHVDGNDPDRNHVSIMAMALGVDWIEKHLTISRFLEVEDYVSALEPDEFSEYVATIRRLEGAFGPADMELNDGERKYRDKAVKKLITARTLEKGRALVADDLEYKRTPRIPEYGGFHDPARVLGRKVVRDLVAGDPILPEDLI